MKREFYRFPLTGKEAFIKFFAAKISFEVFRIVILGDGRK